eukprot:2342984-Pyramimonas_sp.AAC.1
MILEITQDLQLIVASEVAAMRMAGKTGTAISTQFNEPRRQVRLREATIRQRSRFARAMHIRLPGHWG